MENEVLKKKVEWNKNYYQKNKELINNKIKSIIIKIKNVFWHK